MKDHIVGRLTSDVPESLTQCESPAYRSHIFFEFWVLHFFSLSNWDFDTLLFFFCIDFCIEPPGSLDVRGWAGWVGVPGWVLWVGWMGCWVPEVPTQRCFRSDFCQHQASRLILAPQTPRGLNHAWPLSLLFDFDRNSYYLKKGKVDWKPN